MTKENWHQIYSAGEQLNKYPYDFIVSSYFRHRPVRDEANPVKILDLGCGAGNNAFFCAENDAQVLAVDFSTAALDVFMQRADDKGLTERIRTQQVDFEDFELDESGFDMIIDRLAVSHVSQQHALSIYDRVYELMNVGGIVLASLFTTEHLHKDFGEYDEQNDIWSNFKGGIFENLKTAYFYNENNVRHLFRKFTLLSLVRSTEKNVLADNDQSEIWNIVAQK